ncbi:MAG: hypothetical protein QM770_08785 [Tepidisphaeraceae bacterium]
MPDIPTNILADGSDGVIKIVFFLIVGVIWAIAQLVAWLQKQAKKAKERQAQESWGQQPMQAPPPPPIPVQMPRMPVPPPLPPEQQQRKSKRQKQQERQALAARAAEQQRAAQSASRTRVNLDAPAAATVAPPRPHANDQANSVAKNVRMLLQPGSVRESFVLSEILGKPKGMQ